MPRGSIVRLVVVALVAAAVAGAVGYFISWLPEPSSREAGRIDFVFWFVTIICIGIFALVAAVIVYAVFKFRQRPDDEEDGPPVHGHTGLEIAWTAIPAVLVTAISVVSAVALGQNEKENQPLRIKVIAQQFAWTFEYTDFKGLSSPTLNLPKDRQVKLTMEARDVIHSFWVPEFGQKQDAVPGLNPELLITPTRLGTFPVVCTELCGLGHAIMRTNAVVMTKPKFAAWVRSRRKALAGPPGEAGLAVFRAQGCGSCHTLSAAGTRSTTGPNLDQLPQQARRANKPLEAFVRESIVSPAAYLEPGYSDIMPHNYEEQIPPDQLRSLVQYLVRSSKKGAK